MPHAHRFQDDAVEADLDEFPNAQLIDGLLCTDLSMAEPADKPGSATFILSDTDENGFRRVSKGMTSDSGAGDTVGPESEFPEYPTEPSPGSRRGLHYVAAGGAKLRNKGQKRVLIITAEKQLRWVTIQMADVNKTLCSVSKNNDHGFKVVYDKSESYMQDVKTKEKTNLRRQRGVFVLDCWVVPYAMAMSGKVVYRGVDGKKRVATLKASNVEGFNRQVR